MKLGRHENKVFGIIASVSAGAAGFIIGFPEIAVGLMTAGLAVVSWVFIPEKKIQVQAIGLTDLVHELDKAAVGVLPKEMDEIFDFLLDRCEELIPTLENEKDYLNLMQERADFKMMLQTLYNVLGEYKKIPAHVARYKKTGNIEGGQTAFESLVGQMKSAHKLMDDIEQRCVEKPMQLIEGAQKKLDRKVAENNFEVS